MGAPVTLDFSTAQPLTPAAPSAPAQKPGGVSLDFSTAKPISAAPSAPAAQSDPNSISANPGREGIYTMQSPDGRQVQIPYSKISTAGPQGYRFSNQGELARYAKDHSADPVDEGAIDHYLNNLPWWDVPGHTLQLLVGAGAGVEKTVAGLDRAARGKGPLSGPEEQLQLAAATPTRGAVQGTGEFGENVGEFFTGEELLGMVGKGLQGAEKLKAASQAAKLLEDHPVIAKLVKIGRNAVRQGTVAGAQTYAKTGGDKGAALTSAVETGGIGGSIESLGGVAASAVRGLTPEASTGAADYAAEARAAARPHLENVSNAIENAGAAPGAAARPAAAGAPTAGASAARVPSASTMPRAGESPELGPGGEIIPRNAVGEPRATPGVEDTSPTALPGGGSEAPRRLPGNGVVQPKKPALNVNHVLNQIHDFTGAADRLTDVNNAAYDALDRLTNGQFRTVNTEVSRAQKAAWSGGPPQQKEYQDALAKMEDLLNTTRGISPDTVKAIKQGWRASYQLRDMGNIWDRALNGVPGATQVSQEQRGINGKVLMSGLQRAVRDFGRPQLESTLGAGRLDNLERIARLNQTNAQRATFNRGVHEVARYLPIYIGAKVGEHVAGFPGEIGGALLGGAVKPAADAVLDAIKANPKFGNFLTYAIESGADPKKFGPLLATMIQQSNTDSSRQQQAQQEQGGNQ